MFLRVWVLGALLVLANAAEAADFASVNLQFQPDVYVKQAATITVEMQQQLPGLVLEVKTQQRLEGEMRLLSEKTGAPLSEAPLDFEFTPKRLVVQLGANDQLVIHDTAANASNPAIAQLQHLMNKPLHLHLGADYSLERTIEELDALGRDLPQLKAFIPASLFTQTFDQIFAISGKPLATGDTHRKKMAFGDSHLAPMTIDFQVTSANYKEVQADLRGKLDTYKIKIGTVDILKEGRVNAEKTDIVLTVSGVVKGQGRWDRRNALICNMTVEHRYQCTMKVGEVEIPLSYVVVQTLESKRKG